MGGFYDTSVSVTMFVNSSEISAVDFHLVEVSPLHVDTVSHGGSRTCGSEKMSGCRVGNSTFVLSVENDNDFRSRCE